jgi:hypothetical protein
MMFMTTQRPVSLTICTLLAACGLATNAHASDWAAAVDGNWNDAINWSPADVPDSTGEIATLGLIGPYAVSLTNSFSIDALNISNPDAMLGLASHTLTLSSGLNNNGTIVINDDGNTFTARITFSSDTNITGAGSILLNGIGQTNDAAIGAGVGFTMFNGGTHTIHGNGQIEGVVVNNGTILADDAAGAGLMITGQLSGPGTLGADTGTLLLASGSTLSNTTITTSNGGFARVNNGTATISGITNNGDLQVFGGGHFLSMTGSNTNNGTITLNPDLSVFNANLRFDADGTLGGSGNVLMQTAGNVNDSQLIASDGVTGTIGVNQTIEGSGMVDGSGTGVIDNDGTINGNDPTTQLALFGNHTGSGVYRADDGVLGLGNGLNMNGGTFDSSGTGSVNTFTGTSTLSNMTNNGNMGIRGDGHFVSLVGPLTNNGTITMNLNDAVFNAHIQFNANTMIDGTGTITMLTSGNINDAQIIANDGFTGSFGASHTVEGGGQITGNATGVIHNAGTFNGNSDTQPLVLFGNHTGTGTYRADDGVLGLGGGLVMNGGTFDSSGTGSVNTFSGTSTLNNMVNNGQMGVLGSGHFISLVGPLTNNGDIAINANDDIFNAHVEANADVTIDGSGTITLKSIQDTGDARLIASDTFTLTIGAGQVVQGSGRVSGVGDGIVHNEGVLIGNDPSFPLDLRGNHTATGIYRGDNGILGLIGGSILNGGTFESVGAGSVEVLSGTSTISNITNNGSLGLRGTGAFLELLTDLTNNGEININSDDNIFNAHVDAAADVAINGVGSINLSSVQDTGDARLRANAFTLTVGSGQTITGSGNLQGTMHVDGTINPDGAPFRQFTIDEMTLSPTSEFVADLGGLLAGEFDRLLLNSSDTIDLGDATVTVNLDPGYVPVFGDTWDIIDGGTIIGSFGTVNVPAAPTAQIYRVVEEPSRVFAVLTCQADFTGDNFLDVFDVFLFLDLFNAASPRADFTGDGSLDIFDVFLFLDFYNGGCTGV